jgi:geranylgeranyl transferase type-1 subunit beta
LASRQTSELGDENDDDEDDSEDEDDAENNNDTTTHSQTIDTDIESLRLLDDKILSLPKIASIPGDTIPCAGFNGRCNKVADTCYSFWNGATLAVSDSGKRFYPHISPRFPLTVYHRCSTGLR